MTQTILPFFFGALATLNTAACVDAPDAPDPSTDEPSIDQERALLICGDNAVASARTANQDLLVFCITEDVEVIAQSGGIHGERPECALDKFLASTDDTVPVPRALIDSCARRTNRVIEVARPIVPHAVFAAGTDLGQTHSGVNSSYDRGGSYCAADSSTKFVAEQCQARSCGTYEDGCYDWCYEGVHTSLSKTMSSTLGDAGNVADAIVASCNGTTHFRGQRDRGSVDDSWKTMVDIWVSSDTTWSIFMSYNSTLYGDANFRFLASSGASAYHRSTGIFKDN